MKLQCSRKMRGLRSPAESGYTIIELMIAAAIGLMVLTGGYAFLFFSLRAMGSVSAQTVLNQKGGNAIELIQTRVRFATFIFVNSSGDTLTLGIDDDYTADSDHNGRAYDDKDHYEQFKFVGVSSTNIQACATNQLIYISNTNSSVQRVLIPAGVRILPGFKVFSLTNNVAVIRFGIADPRASDQYQSIELQGSALSLNRPLNPGVVSILP